MSAMLMSRCVFSMTFAASATLMEGAVNPRGDDGVRNAREALERSVVFAGDDLCDLLERVLFVARVDALGGVAQLEVAARQARQLGEDGAANVFGDAGIDGGLVDDDGPLRHHLADRLGRADDRREVGDVVPVDRRGDRHDEEVRLGELGGVVGDVERRPLEDVAWNLAVPVLSPFELGDLLSIDVEANDISEVAREGERHGETDIPKTDDRNALDHARRCDAASCDRPDPSLLVESSALRRGVGGSAVHRAVHRPTPRRHLVVDLVIAASNTRCG